MKLTVPAARVFSLETLANDIHENKLLYVSFLGFVCTVSVFSFVLMAF